MWPWDPYDFMNIEDHLDAVGTTTVRKLLGHPSFRPVAEIPAGDLNGEVERIMEIPLEFRIEVDCRECTPAGAYRFLTTDVMESEIEDPPAPGWGTVFVYGMMHPGEEER
jgi:hypothetical protein